MVAEAVPEDIAKDKASVVQAKCLDKETIEPVFPFGGFAFAGVEVMF